MGRKKKSDLETAKSNLFSNTEAFFYYYDQLIKSNKLNISKSKKKNDMQMFMDDLLDESDFNELNSN